MSFIDLDQITAIDPMPGFKGRSVHSENVTVVDWQVKAGSKAAAHAHLHEQINFVLEGQFELTIGDETKILEPGITAIVPSNAVHSGIALSDCVLIAIFHPVREDFR
jgi:quercetin dioxygenase-like cupin family protein